MNAVQVTRLNTVVVLHPTTDLRGGPETQELEAAFQVAWTESHQGIVVNLAEVQHLSSVGFGTIIQCMNKAKMTSTKLAFCGVNRSVEKFLAMVAMRLPNSFATEEEAVAFCSKR